eukprot:CAMPEP_0170549646 /NCGR_PEP_ID=MMETSP0211-20121228/7802_1 /TAXON_ID=311385 /ORGANISM="Pseudokeronopsis sp., Strain OXSARD2" /LENGTH=147 /DNA_ID=CAMNT_0010855789 /DNA_START=214 /DNA_END=657 /DNA_ORIENTATION=+
MTNYLAQKKHELKEMRRQQMHDKRMEIVSQCPSMLDFYENYLSKKKAMKISSSRPLSALWTRKKRSSRAMTSSLYQPERKIVHNKNFRFLMFDDVDMGDEIEAAIYNDGRKIPDTLKEYINKQMTRIMSIKMNQGGKKLHGEDFEIG